MFTDDDRIIVGEYDECSGVEYQNKIDSWQKAVDNVMVNCSLSTVNSSKMTTIQPNKSKLPIMEQFYPFREKDFIKGMLPILFGWRVAMWVAWCDVKESWEVSEDQQIEIREIVSSAIGASGTEIAVITGGEPAMYNLEELTPHWKSTGIKTNIETSGAYP